LELNEIPHRVLKHTKLVYLNYPNNPTAAVASREYLDRIVAACRKHDIVLAYDNPYCEITFDGYVAPSIFEIPGAMDVAVEFHSLSKSFCMTGWRLGWAVGTLRGSAFGAGAEGFFRIALTVPSPRLIEAAERLGKVLATV